MLRLGLEPLEIANGLGVCVVVCCVVFNPFPYCHLFTAFKAKNFITAESFARRLLDMDKLPDKLRKQATKVVQKSQQEGRNALKLNFNPDAKFDICGTSFEPINQGLDLVRCPYCGTAYKMEYSGSLCTTCNISSVGVETVGLTCMMTR